ncbi:Villin-1 protein [Spatholobus suberectus]|nr:Villin-1 protein [Spatholobus suberectus]
MDVLVEGLSPNILIYIVTEGHDPPFFTRFFSWDHSEENIVGNSSERKLAILKGKPKNPEVCDCLEKTMTQSGSPATELSSSNETASFTHKDRNVDGGNAIIYPYERLRVVSANPVTGIDLTKREIIDDELMKDDVDKLYECYETMFNDLHELLKDFEVLQNEFSLLSVQCTTKKVFDEELGATHNESNNVKLSNDSDDSLVSVRCKKYTYWNEEEHRCLLMNLLTLFKSIF